MSKREWRCVPRVTGWGRSVTFREGPRGDICLALLGSVSGLAEGENDESTVEAAMSVVSLQQQRWGESDC